MTRIFVSLVLGAVCCCAAEPSAIAIRGARIVPVSGPPIAAGTVLIRDGIIQAVGENVAIPAGTWIIEGKDLSVYPGLIDALSTLGLPDMAPPPPAATRTPPAAPAPAVPPVPAAPTEPPARGPEDRPMTSSWLNAADLLRPSDNRIERFRSAGFTSAVSFPNKGILAGRGAVIDLAGDKPGRMVVADSAGQYATLTTGGFLNFPGSLLGVFAYIRQTYLDAQHYQAERAAYAASPRGKARPEYDRALEGVLESKRLLLPAGRAVEIDRMIRFARELKQDAILYGAQEGYKCAGLIKSSGVPVLVNLKWPEGPKDPDPEVIDSYRALEARDRAPSTPTEFVKAGVKFALYSGGADNPREVLTNLRKAITAGLSEDDALRALTLSPAEIYGVADRLGSIEQGKIANLVVAKGSLFQEKPQVQFILVDGVKFEPIPEAPPPPGAPPTGGTQ
jgi:imidazolonepropionase-like amidohydrolase